MEKRNDMIDAFNPTPKYVIDLLNIIYISFEQMVHRTYPVEIQVYLHEMFETSTMIKIIFYTL